MPSLRTVSAPSRIAIIAVAAIIATFMLAPPAMAQDFGISGTAYSNGSTYYSQNVRFMTATTTISATFSSLPKNGLVFGAQTQSGVFLGQSTWSSSEINIRRSVSSSNYGAGKGFINFFRLSYKCSSLTGCTPYNFAGSERY